MNCEIFYKFSEGGVFKVWGVEITVFWRFEKMISVENEVFLNRWR
jgi:hypothetical protein